MDRSGNGRRVFLYSTLIGFALMNVALFLHPMSPQDFLGLAISDPRLTILNTDGQGTAVCFWISASVMLAGLFGWVGRSRFVNRMWQERKPTPEAFFNKI